MALDPSSSYSFLETHIFLNVSKDAKIEPLKDNNNENLCYITKNSIIIK